MSNNEQFTVYLKFSDLVVNEASILSGTNPARLTTNIMPVKKQYIQNNDKEYEINDISYIVDGGSLVPVLHLELDNQEKPSIS